jgi:hypothetical protein
MLSSVAKSNFTSCVLAPLTVTSIGRPRRSVKIDRFTPSLPRLVGCLPVVVPAQRRLGHRAVDALPIPTDIPPQVVTSQERHPEATKHAPAQAAQKILPPLSEIPGYGSPRPTRIVRRQQSGIDSLQAKASMKTPIAISRGLRRMVSLRATTWSR